MELNSLLETFSKSNNENKVTKKNRNKDSCKTNMKNLWNLFDEECDSNKQSKLECIYRSNVSEVKDDVFIGLSTSGNSINVLNALDQAKQLNLKTITFLGKSGGSLKGLADLEIVVPGNSTDRIQELHMLLLHIIIENVENKLFPDLN